MASAKAAASVPASGGGKLGSARSWQSTAIPATHRRPRGPAESREGWMGPFRFATETGLLAQAALDCKEQTSEQSPRSAPAPGRGPVRKPHWRRALAVLAQDRGRRRARSLLPESCLRSLRMTKPAPIDSGCSGDIDRLRRRTFATILATPVVLRPAKAT